MNTKADCALKAAEIERYDVAFHVNHLSNFYLFTTLDADIPFDEFDCESLLDDVPGAIRLEVECQFYEWLRNYQLMNSRRPGRRSSNRAWSLD